MKIFTQLNCSYKNDKGTQKSPLGTHKELDTSYLKADVRCICPLSPVLSLVWDGWSSLEATVGSAEEGDRSLE